ncbi:RDD family protein [Psychromonas sp. RZ22]|uniref:RDD family protein n=1 Tax=Psychromonas algarum TaxID=2555643 RepID=UPI0010675D8B|nr:RDD family protein [Psychromonas sp. RZ22]TEW56550.1 RDD family protein [Psychromonas sp. RZ22]
MVKANNTKTPQLILEEQYQACERASFFKRLGAYIYDLFAIGAVLMLATVFALLVVVILAKIAVIDLSLYKDSADYLGQSPLFLTYLCAVIIGFYAYFWSKAGQTIGMKAWRLRVQNSDGSNISFTQSLIRMATSAFGLGTFMALLKGRNAFQDLWAECEVVVLTKELSNWKGFKGMGFMDEDKNK